MSTIQEWNERYALKFAGAEALPRAQRVLLSLVGSGQRVLDVGCGSGFYTTQFRDLGNKMAATDITVEGVRTVVQTGVPVTLSDVEKGLPFADESFDMVPFIEVVEHLLRPDLALREIRRILRPGGLLLLTTPNYAHWVLRLLYLFGVLPVGLRSRPYAGFASRRQADTIPPWLDPHIRFFSPHSLRDYLSDGGFDLLLLRSTFVAFPSGLAPYLPFFLGFPLRVLGKLLGNPDFAGDHFPSLLAAGMMVKAVKR